MNVAAKGDGPWLFDDFEEGIALGRVEIVIDDERLALWDSIYGADDDADRRALPQGLLTAAMMEAYLRVIPKRPPGNVHAGQKLVFSGLKATVGARLAFEFSCLAKTTRRQRGWVTLAVRCSQGAGTLMDGEIQTIWAR